MRTRVVAGNWKMNKDLSGSRELAQAVARAADASPSVEVVISPVNIYLGAVADTIRGSKLKLSAQNMHWAESGAYTGEVGPTMLKEIGCSHVILGHSERREYFGEDDALISQKLRTALAHDLTPIFCFGETLAEREAGRTQSTVEKQIRGGLEGVSSDDLTRIIFAYEPVWAIGTGRTATPEQAQEVHQFIRALLSDMFGTDVSSKIRILYGGSVKADNAAELISQPDIDGALVGGASLKPADFEAIIQAAR